MRERPILFSGPMVRAILDGRKTVTRRVSGLTLQPADGAGHYHVNGLPPYDDPEGPPGYGYLNVDQVAGYCPYGQPGDRLWVRETWRPFNVTAHLEGDQHTAHVQFAAGGESFPVIDGEARLKVRWGEPGRDPWRPSIHMPRWASRLMLEVVSVRTERLHDITEEDARREGVQPAPFCKVGRPDGHEHIEAFEELWHAINGPESWAANPWVWRVEFRRVTP